MMEDAWHDAAALPLPNKRPSPKAGLAQISMQEMPPAVRLEFQFSDRTEQAILAATAKNDQFVEITKIVAINFEEFGKGKSSFFVA
jgi:hypothetical protein